MTTLTIDVLSEQPDDALPIEKLHERAFGPGRFARTAFRLREGNRELPELCFVARVGTFLVGSIRLSRVKIGDTTALVLGPLAVEPAFSSKGIGMSLMTRAIDAARDGGDTLIFLVGDLPYYARVGFARVPMGQVSLPGPVDPARLLYLELQPDALKGVSGVMQAWRH
jgi:predicted N-acetyltransferase YhbS